MKITFTLEELEELTKQAEADSQIEGRDDLDAFNMGCRTAASNMMAKLYTAWSAKLVLMRLAEKEAGV